MVKQQGCSSTPKAPNTIGMHLDTIKDFVFEGSVQDCHFETTDTYDHVGHKTRTIAPV